MAVIGDLIDEAKLKQDPEPPTASADATGTAYPIPVQLFPKRTDHERDFKDVTGEDEELTDPPIFSPPQSKLVKGLLKKTGIRPDIQAEEFRNPRKYGQYLPTSERILLKKGSPRSKDLAHEIGHQLHFNLDEEETKRIADSIKKDVGAKVLFGGMPENNQSVAGAYHERPAEDVAFGIQDAISEVIRGEKLSEDALPSDSANYSFAKELLNRSDKKTPDPTILGEMAMMQEIESQTKGWDE